MYTSTLSLYLNFIVVESLLSNKKKEVNTVCIIFICHSLEQTTQTSSLPSTYGGHLREPHRASTR